MNKHEIKDLIYKHFEPKDVGIGILNCIHEDKDVDKLAENLVNLFSIPVVIVPKGTLFCDCELPTSDFELDDGTICCCACEKELAK